jgi:hypothetical protein
MSTRRDDLAAALTNVEENDGALSDDFMPPSAVEAPDATEGTASTQQPNAAAPDASQDGRARDANGRFAAAANKTRTEIAEKLQPAGTTTSPTRAEVPKSWKTDMHASWATLDPNVANYVAQREQEMQRGVDDYRSRAEPALAFFTQLSPFLQGAQQRGATMEQIASDARQLYETRANLYHQDPQVRLQTLLQVADSAGLPVRQWLTGQGQAPAIDPNMQAIYQRMQQLEGSLAQRDQFEQQQVQMQVDNEIATFAGDAEKHPHFQALSETMGQLIQAGLANDLDSAYSKALRMNDDLWQQEQARQRQAADQQARTNADKAAKAARSNAVSTRTSTPGQVAATTGGAPKGRRAALEEAFSGLQSGRI